MKKLGKYTFEHKVTGKLLFDPGKGTKHFDPYWCIVSLDYEISSYYRWLLKRHGQDTESPNKLWGFHVSTIKGEEPTKNKELWGCQDQQEITIWYGNYVSYSNGRHAWLNCYSEDLCQLRDFYGLDINDGKLKYHATLGRLKNPWEPDVKRPGSVYKGSDGVDSI